MLTGDLVRLRPYQMTDLDRIMTWVNDPEVTQYMSSSLRYGATRDEEEVWLRSAVDKIHPPNIVYAIEVVGEEPLHIGSIGLHDIAAENRKACLGIMIGDKAYWSRGYGTDAIKALLRFAFDEINLNRVWLAVHADNARAIACYRKCGFTNEGLLRQDRYKAGAYCDTIVMGILASEFRTP